MTQDEIIEMARQVARQPDRVYAPDECEFLYYFANLIAQQEREACAKVCEDKVTLLAWATFAQAIRARGDKK